jgi:hypothetical protein
VFEYSPVRVVRFQSVKSIRVVPNPVTDIIKITTGNWAAIKEIRLLDASGKLLYRNLRVQNGISMIAYHRGIYLLQIVKNDGTVQVEKVIKQ